MVSVRKGKKKENSQKYDMQTTLIGRKELELSKDALQRLRELPSSKKK